MNHIVYFNVYYLLEIHHDPHKMLIHILICIYLDHHLYHIYNNCSQLNIFGFFPAILTVTLILE